MSGRISTFRLGLGALAVLGACHAEPRRSGASQTPATEPVPAAGAPEPSAEVHPPAPVGKVFEETSTGQRLIVLEGLVIPFEATGESQEVELRFLGVPPGSDASLAISFLPGRRTSMRCDVVVFSPPRGADEERWVQLNVVERASSEGSVRLDVALDAAALEAMVAVEGAGLQICGERALFTTEQQGTIAEFVSASIGPRGVTVIEQAGEPETIGIAPCDTFLSGYRHCIETKAPDALRKQLLDAVGKTRVAWHGLAGNSANRTGLEKLCAATLHEVRETSAAWGCEF